MKILRLLLLFLCLPFLLIACGGNSSSDTQPVWHSVGPQGATVKKVIFDEYSQTLKAVSPNSIFRYDSENSKWLPDDDLFFEGKEIRDYTSSADGTVLVSTSLGLYKKTGSSWTEIYSGEELFAVAISPSNSQFIFLQTGTALYQTEDGGTVWTPVDLTLADLDSYFLTISFNSSASEIVFICANEAIYKSTDSGQSWTALPQPTDGDIGGNPITSLLIEPVEPQALIALSGYRLYKSLDGGTSWSLLDGANSFGGISTVAISPVNSKVLYAGLEPTFQAVLSADGSEITMEPQPGPQAIKSEDGGVTWNPVGPTLVFDWLYSSWINSLAIDPSGTLFAATANGMFSTADVLTWEETNTGLHNLQVQDIHLNLDLNRIFVGHSEFGLFSADLQGTHWDFNAWLDPVQATGSSRANPDILLSGNHRSIDGGNSWTTLFDPSASSFLPIYAPSLYLDIPKFPEYNFIGPVACEDLVFDNRTQSVAYGVCAASAAAFVRSTDAGETWSVIDPLAAPFAPSSLYPATNQSRLSGKNRLKMFASDPGVLYGWSAGGGAAKSADGGDSWTPLTATLPSQAIDDLALSAESNHILFLIAENRLYKSVDSGAKWDDVTGGLAGKQLICLNRDNKDNLYIGTDNGVYRTEEKIISFENLGMENYSVTAVEISNSSMYLGTAGHGLFMMDLN